MPSPITGIAQQAYVAITPSNTTVYSPPLQDIFIGTAGALAIVGRGDAASITLPSGPTGWLRLPYPVSQVLSTGTGATNIFGCQAGS